MAGGRPTKFKPEFNEQVIKLCHLGATDEQLAVFFNVHSDTIQNWKKEYPEFFESIKRGKQEFDASVADALAHRALGYSHPETKVQWVEDYVKDEETGQMLKSGRWETLDMIRHYPPETAAAFIWLKNRQGWRDKQELEHSGSVAYEHTGLDELKRLAKERANRLFGQRDVSEISNGNGKH